MEDSADQQKGQQIKSFTSSLTEGLKAVAEQDPNRIGVGITTSLEKPIKDSFGTFTTKKDYIAGCDIGKVLSTSEGVVLLKTQDGEIIRIIEIGKTPDLYNPNAGGKLIEDAGDYKDYLLAIKKVDPNTPTAGPIFRYIDPLEVEGAVAKKGQNASLNPVPELGRQIVIQGTVNSVQSLRG